MNFGAQEDYKEIYLFNIVKEFYQHQLKKKFVTKMVELIKTNQINKLDYIKDSVILEFLGLSADNTYLENDLESSILTHFQKFLMELGKGYAFVPR